MARITVVDDYPEFLDMVSAVLDDLEGHDVSAFDGMGTIENVVASEPELLIVDLRTAVEIPQDGNSVVLARGDERLRHVPMIVCSADVESLREADGQFAKPGTFMLEKPFALDQLIGVVNQALDVKADGHPSAGGAERSPLT